MTGTITQGKVALPAGTATASGGNDRWVRSDGAFTDAVDPAAPARQLRSVATARRKGCTFTGTLAPSPSPSPTPAASASPVAAPLAARAGTASPSPAGFTARIDSRGRLERLTTKAPPDGLSVSAAYSDFGLTVTPSAPPSDTTHQPPSSSATRTVTGNWTGTWATDLATGDFTAQLTQNGHRMTGRLTVVGTGCDLDGPISGTVGGDRISFGTVRSTGKITFSGGLDGAGMHGTFTTDCYNATGDWTARRSPAPQ